jgi:hypothetical protein
MGHKNQNRIVWLRMNRFCLLFAILAIFLVGCARQPATATSLTGKWKSDALDVFLELHPDNSFAWYPNPAKPGSAMPHYEGHWTKSANKITLETLVFNGKPVSLIKPLPQVLSLSAAGNQLTDPVLSMDYHKV